MTDRADIVDVNLRGAEIGPVGRAFARPRRLVWVGLGGLVAIGWAYLAAMVVQLVPVTDMSETGYGMGVFNLLSNRLDLGPLGQDLLRSICGPTLALSAGEWSWSAFALVFAMWGAMALAMMVPSAAPMVWTYADIAETARAKGMAIVPAGVLLAGYLAVWLAFCIAAALGQWLLTSGGLLSDHFVLVSLPVAEALLIGAGIYQFLPVKDACLVKCRTPLPFFMTNWSDRPWGVFKMGLRQGAFCVACCWAMMLVMFSVGLMNVIWMAALAVVMALEKIVPEPKWIVRGSGVVFIVFGAALITGTFIG